MIAKPQVDHADVVRAWLPALLYMGLIFTISSIEVVAPFVSKFPFRDKGVHFVEYAVLGFLSVHASFRTWPRFPRFRTLMFGTFLAAMWGLSDEVHQAFVPGRSAELSDVVADTCGACVGGLLRAMFRSASRITQSKGASSS